MKKIVSSSGLTREGDDCGPRWIIAREGGLLDKVD